MTLRAKLAIGIFTIGIILVLPLIFATRTLETLRDRTRALKDREFAATLLLGRLRSANDDLLDAELALGIASPTDAPVAFQRTDSALARVGILADSLAPLGLDSTRQHVRSALERAEGYATREYQAIIAGRAGAADSLSADSLRPALADVVRATRRAERELGVRTATQVDRAADAVEEAQRATLLSFALAALLATLVAVLLTRAISRPVRDLEEGMAKVADGEFAYRLAITPNRHDEFGRLAESYRAMTVQLAELDKLKAEFISVASHELKTPINVIMGYLQLLQEGVYGELTTKQREIGSVLEAQCRSLSRLVKQLLDISRFEAGGGKLEVRPVALREFLGDLERAFQVLAHQREVTLGLRISEDAPDEVTWDADRINEVLGNLLSNAFKFTSRGGRVDLAVDGDGTSVQIEVRDTGAGIPSDQLPHVFDKFFQADNQDAASAKGTGLGLAIAKSIVEAHGGTIECESTAGVGTAFMIVLPTRVSLRRAAVARLSGEATAAAGASA